MLYHVFGRRRLVVDIGSAIGENPHRDKGDVPQQSCPLRCRRVWDYTFGGYQVIKKWLSYREQPVLGRALKPDEAAYVSEMIRRIAAILLMGPALDANYTAAKANAVEWKER